MNQETPVRSFAQANRELIAAYQRYLTAHGDAATTIRSYLHAVTRLVDSLGSASVVAVERTTIRCLFADWCSRGLTDNSIRLHVCALRSFFKFITLSGLTRHNPMLQIGNRKISTRLPVVLTVEQVVEKLIAAARDPFERAVPEVLYSTGVRVSEFVNLRLEDIQWGADGVHSIRVKRGKGDKDRVVLFGAHAEKAIREFQKWRPSQAGFLFEVPARCGSIHLLKRGSSRIWFADFYVDRHQRQISLGPLRDIPTKERAREVFERIAVQIPGFRVLPQRPYGPDAIRGVLKRLAHRAGIGRVHPHALRRAMASHMLQRGGNLRVIQDLLGHERLNSTMRYTWLDASDLKKVHEKCHPFEQGGTDAKTDYVPNRKR